MGILFLIVGIIFGLVGVMLFNLLRRPIGAEDGQDSKVLARELASAIQVTTQLKHENESLKKQLEQLREGSA